MKDTVVNKLKENVPIYERQEKINYDRYLFYPTLGLLLNFFLVCF